jgi:hypothetical protein
VKIYGKKIIEFERWCNITKDMLPLIPLADLFIKIADLRKKNRYAVTYIEGQSIIPIVETPTELKLPPWLIPANEN